MVVLLIPREVECGMVETSVVFILILASVKREKLSVLVLTSNKPPIDWQWIQKS